MADNSTNLPSGAGSTTGSTSGSTTGSASGSTGSTTSTTTTVSAGTSIPATAGSDLSSSTTAQPATSAAALTTAQDDRETTATARIDFDADQHRSDSRPAQRQSDVSERTRSKPNPAVVVGAALAGAVAGGAIPFMLSGRQSRRETALVDESVVINRPARELYDFWRDFTNLPQFMDNIQSVEKLGAKRSHWVIKAPAGTTVEFDSYVTDEIPGKLIAWESEAGASVPNRGRVEFNESSSGATVVRARISYEPPAGAAGRLVAKLFQREPSVQARQDLSRLKELMENGRGR